MLIVVSVLEVFLFIMGNPLNDKPEKARFIGLDGLRGVAAISVLSCHVPDMGMHHVLPRSFLAVDLFFILSGFVLTHAYERHLVGGLKVADFMWLRLVRLYPLYILGTLIAAALTMAEILRWHHLDPMAFAATLSTALLFLPTPPQISINSAPLYPLNSPAYTLFFELAVNLAFALLVLRLNGYVISALMAVGLCGMLYFSQLAGTIGTGAHYDFWLSGFPRVMFSFFMGVSLYRLWLSNRLAWLELPSWLPMIALLCVFALRGGGAQIELLCCVLLLPTIVIASANGAPSGHFARLCLLLGVVSYPFYILQEPVVRAFSRASHFLLGQKLEAFGIAGTIVVCAFLFALSLAATVAYDSPIRRWLTGKSGRLRTSAAGNTKGGFA